LDIDMHYYGTYALARAAGVKADAAATIAHAAQYVDDSIGLREPIVHPDGARFHIDATSHHVLSPAGVIANNNLDDQQLVWVPFHFLPGGNGDEQSQKLVCIKDSPFARKMVEDHIAQEKAFYWLELMGITAHVYADTFAHYGFSGVSSRVNRVIDTSIKAENFHDATGRLERFFAKFGLQDKFANFRTAIQSKIGTLGTELDPAAGGALGHGAVATFPDQPYLRWSYTYEMPDQAGQKTVTRDNAKDFEEAAVALYGMFKKVAAGLGGEYADKKGPIEFAAKVLPKVREIVHTEEPTTKRIELWKTAMTEGAFSSTGEEIPTYDPEEWRRDVLKLGDYPTVQEATAQSAYRFHRAAQIHRNYVLLDLLPRMGVYII
jgi:hypothetical protein